MKSAEGNMRMTKKTIYGITCLVLASMTILSTGCNRIPLGGNVIVEGKEETQAPPVTSKKTYIASPPSESGALGDLRYGNRSRFGGKDSRSRGYGVLKEEEDELPYKIVIHMGECSTGGYSIEITEIEYDGSLLTIRVHETEPGPTDMVTEALTYPWCALELDRLPEKISVFGDVAGNDYPKLYDRSEETESAT